MKRILLMAAAICYTLIPQTHASEDNSPIASETVKIYSYNLTKNEQVMPNSLASGTVISSDGLILTNHHVVTDEYDESYETFGICVVVNVNEKPECRLTASLIAKDKSRDIALLKINDEDIYGESFQGMPFIEPDAASSPAERAAITVIGFPGIGGETITTTRGVVSGYEEKGGIQRIKTDTTISSGNSGGTVKNDTGSFIGVPSYIRSRFGTIGYIIPMSEIIPWLNQHRGDEPEYNDFAQNLLNKQLQREVSLQRTRVYESATFPYYSVDMPYPWKLHFSNEAVLVLKTEVRSETIGLSFRVSPYSYRIKKPLMQFLLKKLEKNQHELSNYKKEPKNFKGIKGYEFQYDEGESRVFKFFGSKENMLFAYNYTLRIENLAETKPEVDKVLATFRLKEGENNNPIDLKHYRQKHPDVTIKASGDFQITPLFDSIKEDHIVEIENPKSFEQQFIISEKHLDREFWDLSIEEILEEETENISGKLLNQSADVIIDGLKGYSYSYSFRGDDFNQEKKGTVVRLLKGKRYLEFKYTDLTENYEKNLQHFVYTLENFEYRGEENQRDKGEYNIPSFQGFYKDIQHHIFEEHISTLVSKNIYKPAGEYFYPERNVTRLDAVSAILESKIFVEKGRNQQKTKRGISNASKQSGFRDIYESKHHKMLSYAVGEGYIKQQSWFRPDDKISLSEVLAILCKVYELQVWDPPYEIDWYLPYYYKGIDLQVIPFDVQFYTILSKGQFSALLTDFVGVVGERDDF